ncbi:hypothetical protein [Polaribacter sp. SA4-12]|uniref:hypothetical protein n=1 Tax=Polaribacter sp. SA4-12 TaxID=1312072 RepID=UPI000B3CB961|nr:hypothetical protein [Polaribacter sp. SA4-12]ARV15584.1 hypothetical protein BTO07_10740 [Polaribacter sp. SA4-12]
MKLFKKTYWLIYPILIVVFMLIFDQLYKMDSLPIKAGICALLAFFLSPRKKIILTQTRKVKQITWLFLKEPITID